jgi:serine/threonine protein kinase
LHPEIPGYKIIEKLYENRLTRVYRGTRLTNSEPVILKILRPEAAVQKDEITRFKHEFDIVTKLNVPGIVKPLGLKECRAA